MDRRAFLKVLGVGTAASAAAVSSLSLVDRILLPEAYVASRGVTPEALVDWRLTPFIDLQTMTRGVLSAFQAEYERAWPHRPHHSINLGLSHRIGDTVTVRRPQKYEGFSHVDTLEIAGGDGGVLVKDMRAIGRTLAQQASRAKVNVFAMTRPTSAACESVSVMSERGVAVWGVRTYDVVRDLHQLHFGFLGAHSEIVAHDGR